MSDLEPRDQPEPVADPRDMRCSDSERELVAEVIRTAAGDGRLTLDEMSDRLDVVYSARTYRDLEPAVRDLPGASVPGLPSGTLPAPRSTAAADDRANEVVVGGQSTSPNAVAILSETKRTGQWFLPTEYASVAVLGSVELDLREAQLGGTDIQLQANAVLGEVKVIVGDGVTVSTIGTPVLGEYEGPHEEPVPDRPHVTLNGVALFGSVEVKRKKRRRKR